MAETDNAEIAAFAATYGARADAVRELIVFLGQYTAGPRYVFWTAGGGGAGAQGRRERTLLAFPTPDAALAFAQRNKLGRGADQPRLRRLSLVQLLGAVLREPAIVALLLVDEAGDTPMQAGRLPPGVRVERAELVERLRGTPGADGHMAP